MCWRKYGSIYSKCASNPLGLSSCIRGAGCLIYRMLRILLRNKDKMTVHKHKTYCEQMWGASIGATGHSVPGLVCLLSNDALLSEDIVLMCLSLWGSISVTEELFLVFKKWAMGTQWALLPIAYFCLIRVWCFQFIERLFFIIAESYEHYEMLSNSSYLLALNSYPQRDNIQISSSITKHWTKL